MYAHQRREKAKLPLHDLSDFPRPRHEELIKKEERISFSHGDVCDCASQICSVPQSVRFADVWKS
jgi:hypothetical protein